MDRVDPAMPRLTDPRTWQLTVRLFAMPKDTNAYGDIFGGWLLSQADLAGGAIAVQVAQGRVATVAVKEFQFMAPVLVGDLVEGFARLVRVGRSSMTIEVQIWAQREPDPQSRHQVAAANFTYVSVDENGRSKPVPNASELAEGLTRV
ncbi:acyl-CoA thioesterase [Imhoffiella purpurea]|uniref:Cytosolic long-chain acyl-CoA thioester hydrolase family protein n=1 Tax=Imhoffiella purpurea TaxID=1249627 RepID=W9W382_9GAMM|nr:acyl-CoA thioesterase [Imhoffiella purpurea]EXJ17030.1 cytosolic long-chain acyl-CoA thioester hydrolase family protein [Imhoffiella purpurea]